MHNSFSPSQAGAVVALSAGSLTLEVAPRIGGSIAAFFGTIDGRRVDWLRPAGPDDLASGDPLRMASFPLIPFCNRIREGTFSFGGEVIRLARNYAQSRHAIHGVAWRMPWIVERARESAASLTLDHPPGAWPFAFSARQDFSLTPERLSVSLAVTNRSDRPMPLGFGHHPYVARTPGTVVKAEVGAIWATDAEVMPTRREGGWVVERLAEGLPIREVDLDNNFTGWTRRAEVIWPERGQSLILRAEEPLRFLVAYTPLEADFFCLEPVSNCTDWPNLTHLGSEAVGGMVLPPGETAEASFTFEPVWQ